MERHDRSKTKIIATIGPGSSSKDVLRKLFMEGIDCCRLNLAHGTYQEHLKVINNILELNDELSSKVALLADLQGPKLRIGEVLNNLIELKENKEVTFITEACVGNQEKLFINYREFPKDVKPGETILIDDGKIKLRVTETNGKNKVKAKIIHGGILSSKKGVNLPDTSISLPSLTKKDIEDVNFILNHEVDWIGLSFVRSATDIVDLKEIIKKKKKYVKVIAKIEKPEALNEIDNIIDVADGIMVARGDLGVEIPFDRVPFIQKQIVNKCINNSKPVIIATQMLESMISNFRPTRAEANDVANAVFDGADTLMLSGETSIGKYPVDAIKAMQRVIDYAEGKEFVLNHEHIPDCKSISYLPDSICYNACKMADLTNAKAIITFTHSGATAFKISSHRPKADIFVFTSNEQLVKKLYLVWGVRAFYLKHENHVNDAIDNTIEILKSKGYIKGDDVVVHVGSIPIKKRGQTNMMKISYVK
jgi:pyruvate kinase